MAKGGDREVHGADSANSLGFGEECCIASFKSLATCSEMKAPTEPGYRLRELVMAVVDPYRPELSMLPVRPCGRRRHLDVRRYGKE